jgi:hypothetical protein
MVYRFPQFYGIAFEVVQVRRSILRDDVGVHFDPHGLKIELTQSRLLSKSGESTPWVPRRD